MFVTMRPFGLVGWLISSGGRIMGRNQSFQDSIILFSKYSIFLMDRYVIVVCTGFLEMHCFLSATRSPAPLFSNPTVYPVSAMWTHTEIIAFIRSLSKALSALNLSINYSDYWRRWGFTTTLCSLICSTNNATIRVEIRSEIRILPVAFTPTSAHTHTLLIEGLIYILVDLVWSPEQGRLRAVRARSA